MASSYRKFTFNGSTADVAVTFGYLDKSHVSLKVGGTLIDPSAYTWTDDATIHITAGAPIAGTSGEVRRTTPGDPLTDFQPGNLDSSDLNYAILQSLYVAAEAADRQGDTEAGGWITADEGSGGTVTKGSSGEVAMFDALGNIIPGFDVGDIAGAAAAATTAVDAAISADTSEGNALASATLAQQWAANPEDVVVSGGLYSAYHYMKKAMAYVISTFATAIHGAASKSSPADDDELGITDSAAAWVGKKLRLFDLMVYLAGLNGLERISGCETVYTTTTTIQMKAGWVFFKGKRTTFGSALVKSFSGTFTAGNAGGFLDTGILQASKTYFVHAVRNLSTGAGDWVASLQSDPALVSTANLSGWEVQGRVNLVLTTSGGVIRQYTQDGNEYRLTTQVTEISAGSWATADFQFVSAPAGISTELIYSLHNFQNANCDGQVAVWTEAASGPVIGVVRVANVSSAMSVDVGQRTRTRSSGLVRSQAVQLSGTGAHSVFMQGFNDYTAPRRNGASA